MEEDKNRYLIESTKIKKEWINKIIILITLTFTVVISATIAGLLMAKSHNEKMAEEYHSQIENISQEVEQETEEKEVLTNPVYSENAKNRIQNIYKGNNEEKVAYLTFDDGPSSNITPQILEKLKVEGVKATFFVLGSRVELYPQLVKQEYEEGHYIANHGYSHNYSSIYTSPNAVLDEYNKAEQVIRNAIENEDYSSYLFRFPGGSSGGKYSEIKKEAMKLLDENDIAHINWNALTNDAVGKPTAESVINNLKTTIEGKNSVVILMHDSGTKQLTADTLVDVIKCLREQGYSFKNFYDIMCE